MRLWTLHPRYLDRAGLCGLWRESLLAQKVLQGGTVGYRKHPQLLRFRAQPDPVAALATYLQAVADEGQRRGYRFDRAKIAPARVSHTLPATEGQLLYEWARLLGKLHERDPQRYDAQAGIALPDPHPLFIIVPGPVEAWEIRKELA